MRRTSFAILACAVLSWSTAQAQFINTPFDVWPNAVPNAKGPKAAPKVRKQEQSNQVYLSDITNPTLEEFKPTAEANGKAVIVCPGGAYAFLAYDKYTGDRRSVIVFGLITFLIGCLLAAGTELGQAFLTDYRTGDSMDFLADFIALFSGSLIATSIDLLKLRHEKAAS